MTPELPTVIVPVIATSITTVSGVDTDVFADSVQLAGPLASMANVPVKADVGTARIGTGSRNGRRPRDAVMQVTPPKR